MKPRIRTIKPETWQDERITGLSREARLLFLGLITMADDEGRFRASKSAIAGWVYPEDEDAFELLPRWVGELRDSGLIVFYVVNERPYGAFRHWRKHQKINKPTPSDLPAPPDRKVARENQVKAGSTTGVLPDDSGSSPGGFPEGSGRTPDPTHDPIRSDPDPVFELTQRFAAGVRANDAKFDADKAARSRTWLKDMGALLAARGQDVAEIQRVIDFCVTDDFERTVVLSPGKLKLRFTGLLLKATPVPTSATNVVRGEFSRFKQPSQQGRVGAA